MTISAPSTFRQYQDIPPLNRHQNDYSCENGTRICLPCYIDPSISLRKEILNAVRTKASELIEVEQPNSMSGISVMSSSSRQPQIEQYLGMSIDILRNVLFQRGGLEASLVLKLQNITGLQIVTDKDFTAAFKLKQSLVKGFSKEYPYTD